MKATVSQGKSEYKSKAFVRHSLLESQNTSVFYDTSSRANRAGVSREALPEGTEIIVPMCVNSVCQSRVCKSCFYCGRTPTCEVSLLQGIQLLNCT